MTSETEYTHTHTCITRNCTGRPGREFPQVSILHLLQPDKREPELWDPPMGVCSQDLRRWRYPFHTDELIFSYGPLAIGATHISRNYQIEFAIWYF